jgi:hypothetical protein
MVTGASWPSSDKVLLEVVGDAFCASAAFAATAAQARTEQDNGTGKRKFMTTPIADKRDETLPMGRFSDAGEMPCGHR